VADWAFFDGPRFGENVFNQDFGIAIHAAYNLSFAEHCTGYGRQARRVKPPRISNQELPVRQGRSLDVPASASNRCSVAEIEDSAARLPKAAT
jgi:hypothetical protein